MTDFLGNDFCDKKNHQFICKELIRRSIAKLSAELEPPLLDIGCGTKPYDIYFKDFKKINCDIDPGRGLIDIICAASFLPFPNESFSSVLCTEVLEHVPDPNKAVNSIHRVLKRGGRALVTVPCWWPAHELPFDYYRYPEHGLRLLFESNGFRILQLLPRGGLYALLGQIIVLLCSQYFTSRSIRALWNSTVLRIDDRKKNFSATLGWTILVEK